MAESVPADRCSGAILYLTGQVQPDVSAVPPPAITWQRVISSSLEVQCSQIHGLRNVENDQPVHHLIRHNHVYAVSERRAADHTSYDWIDSPCGHKGSRLTGWSTCVCLWKHQWQQNPTVDVYICRKKHSNDHRLSSHLADSVFTKYRKESKPKLCFMDILVAPAGTWGSWPSLTNLHGVNKVLWSSRLGKSSCSSKLSFSLLMTGGMVAWPNLNAAVANTLATDGLTDGS